MSCSVLFRATRDSARLGILSDSRLWRLGDSANSDTSSLLPQRAAALSWQSLARPSACTRSGVAASVWTWSETGCGPASGPRDGSWARAATARRQASGLREPGVNSCRRPPRDPCWQWPLSPPPPPPLPPRSRLTAAVEGTVDSHARCPHHNRRRFDVAPSPSSGGAPPPPPAALSELSAGGGGASPLDGGPASHRPRKAWERRRSSKPPRPRWRRARHMPSCGTWAAAMPSPRASRTLDCRSSKKSMSSKATCSRRVCQRSVVASRGIEDGPCSLFGFVESAGVCWTPDVSGPDREIYTASNQVHSKVRRTCQRTGSEMPVQLVFLGHAALALLQERLCKNVQYFQHCQ